MRVIGAVTSHDDIDLLCRVCAHLVYLCIQRLEYSEDGVFQNAHVFWTKRRYSRV